MKYDRLSDEELISRIQRDDVGAFSELYDRYHAALWRYARNHMRCTDDAKDIVQDVFTTLWDKRLSIHIHTACSSFLYRMTINRVINKVERTKYAEAYMETIKVRYDAGERTTEQQIYERELRRCFEEGVSSLPPRARQVFELSRNEEMTYQEIGDHLHISKNSVKTHLKISLKILRNKLTSLFLFFL